MSQSSPAVVQLLACSSSDTKSVCHPHHKERLTLQSPFNRLLCYSSWCTAQKPTGNITVQFQVCRPRNGTALVRGLKAPRQGREYHTAVYDLYHITMVALNSPSSIRDRYAGNDIPSGQLHKNTNMWKPSPLPLRHIQHRKLGSLYWNIALTEQNELGTRRGQQ